jgi:hypothetical protein
MIQGNVKISGHQQNWGYEEAPRRGRGYALLVVADFLTDSPNFPKFSHLPV